MHEREHRGRYMVCFNELIAFYELKWENLNDLIRQQQTVVRSVL